MLTENLELLEKVMYQIKALLKEEDYGVFEDVKTRTVNKLRLEQIKTNPGRPNTNHMNNAIAKKN